MRGDDIPDDYPPTDTASRLRAALAEYDAAMVSISGCGDGYCMVTGRATGMHTNAGCRCWRDGTVARRTMLAARRLRDVLETLT
jgi:hypothetical protein